MKLFKAFASNSFGHFCGFGGYGTQAGSAMHRSPKRAMELAIQRMRQDNSQADPQSGHVGGGVPILCERTLTDPKGVVIVRKY